MEKGEEVGEEQLPLPFFSTAIFRSLKGIFLARALPRQPRSLTGNCQLFLGSHSWQSLPGGSVL